MFGPHGQTQSGACIHVFGWERWNPAPSQVGICGLAAREFRHDQKGINFQWRFVFCRFCLVSARFRRSADWCLLKTVFSRAVWSLKPLMRFFNKSVRVIAV